MAKPSPSETPRRLLALELWGLGDTVLVVPFLRAAARHHEVTLVAQARAAVLVSRFAPEVVCMPIRAPWTSFRGKYRLLRWPWRDLVRVTRELRQRRFELGLSARPDPRDHLWLRLAGAERRLGFARAGSGLLLTEALPRPSPGHRADHWTALARRLGFEPEPPPGRLSPARPRFAVAHLGAGHVNRAWPRERWALVVDHLRSRGWEVLVLDDSLRDLGRLIDLIAPASAFLGNDSGPGHLAALLGVPTFTVFGPQLPALFAPRHPDSAWIEGGACPHKPCWDNCRFDEPRCLRAIEAPAAALAVDAWLRTLSCATDSVSP